VTSSELSLGRRFAALFERGVDPTPVALDLALGLAPELAGAEVARLGAEGGV